VSTSQLISQIRGESTAYIHMCMKREPLHRLICVNGDLEQKPLYIRREGRFEGVPESRKNSKESRSTYES